MNKKQIADSSAQNSSKPHVVGSQSHPLDKLITLNDFVDNSFLENYLQLNDYNKEIIDTMVKQLIKLQKKDASKNLG